MLKGKVSLDAPFGLKKVKEVLKVKPAATARELKAALAVQEIKPEDEWLDNLYDQLVILKTDPEFRAALTDWMSVNVREVKYANLETTPDA